MERGAGAVCHRREGCLHPGPLRLKLAFQDFYPPQKKLRLAAEAYFSWAMRSRVNAMLDGPRTTTRHWAGVLPWFTSDITSGLLEGIHSLIQAAKAKARNYRSYRNLGAMTYLITGKLDLNPTHL
jgi:transposase